MQPPIASAEGNVALLNGGTLACIVEDLSQPPCPAEMVAMGGGARIVRLNAANLLEKLHDRSTLGLLGKLYDGVIVPDSWSANAAQLAQGTGIPIVRQGQPPSAPREPLAGGH